MGRAGPGLFDSDSFWDAVGDLVDVVGVDLANAGFVDFYDGPLGEKDEDDPIVLSVEDTASHLNNGNFRRCFEIFKGRHDHYMLIILVVLSMKVGAAIEEKYLRYVQSIYPHVEAWLHLPECREQIRVACMEYASGQPYTIKNFDFGGDEAYAANFEESQKMMVIGLGVSVYEYYHALTRTDRRTITSVSLCRNAAETARQEISRRAILNASESWTALLQPTPSR